jgi:hypothetical protein
MAKCLNVLGLEVSQSKVEPKGQGMPPVQLCLCAGIPSCRAIETMLLFVLESAE